MYARTLQTMPRGIARALALAVAVLVALVPEMAFARGYRGFPDVQEGTWYADEGVIGYSVDYGLMSGYPDGRFGPSDEVSRGQAITVLWRMAGEPRANSTHFDDVDYGQYYGNAISWARSVALAEGYGGTNNFGPDDPVTREQLAKFVAVFARISGEHVPSSGDASSFRDAASISDWAVPYISWCASKGIITGREGGDGSYADPQRKAERAQLSKIATVLHRDVLKQANSSISPELTNTSDGYDYFYSSVGGGICKAKPGDPTTHTLISTTVYENVEALTTGAGRIFYAHLDSISYPDHKTVFSSNLSGSDRKELFTYGTYEFISGMQHVNNRLYILMKTNEVEDRGYSLKVASMNADGSDRRVVFSTRDFGIESALLTADSVYYVKNGKELYVAPFGGSGRRLYRSQGEGLYLGDLVGNRIVCCETAYGSSGAMLGRVFTIKKDGSDERTIFQPQGETRYSYIGVANGRVIIGHVVEDTAFTTGQGPWEMYSISPTGSDTRFVRIIDTYAMAAKVSNGHFVLSASGSWAGAQGVVVYAYDFGGDRLATYVE